MHNLKNKLPFKNLWVLGVLLPLLLAVPQQAYSEIRRCRVVLDASSSQNFFGHSQLGLYSEAQGYPICLPEQEQTAIMALESLKEEIANFHTSGELPFIIQEDAFSVLDKNFYFDRMKWVLSLEINSITEIYIEEGTEFNDLGKSVVIFAVLYDPDLNFNLIVQFWANYSWKAQDPWHLSFVVPASDIAERLSQE